MKNLAHLFLAFLFFAVFSCDEVDEFTQFNLNYSQEIVIESSNTLDLPFNVLTPETTTNSKSTFENNNTNQDLVEQINLKKLELEIKSPSNGNFNFLNSINIFISADNLPEKKIAWLENIPANSQKIVTLDTTTDDLKEFLVKDKIFMRVETVTDESISTDHRIMIDSEFFVDAKILGV